MLVPRPERRPGALDPGRTLRDVVVGPCRGHGRISEDALDRRSPAGAKKAIGVDEGDDVARCQSRTQIPQGRDRDTRGLDDGGARRAPDDLEGPVRRPVVDNEDLVFSPALAPDMVQAGPDEPFTVEDGDYEAHTKLRARLHMALTIGELTPGSLPLIRSAQE